MMRMKQICMLIAIGSVTGAALFPQKPLFEEPKHAGPKAEAVEYLYPEQVTLPAGKASAVALHFRVAPGLHINSHKPKEEFLIPTTFSVPAGEGVQLESAKYPDGVEYALAVDPGTKLNVYTGEFTIDARLVPEAGDHLVEARLRYQACDENACMPPKTIKVAIDVVGR